MIIFLSFKNIGFIRRFIAFLRLIYGRICYDLLLTKSTPSAFLLPKNDLLNFILNKNIKVLQEIQKCYLRGPIPKTSKLQRNRLVRRLLLYRRTFLQFQRCSLNGPLGVRFRAWTEQRKPEARGFWKISQHRIVDRKRLREFINNAAKLPRSLSTMQQGYLNANIVLLCS